MPNLSDASADTYLLSKPFNDSDKMYYERLLDNAPKKNKPKTLDEQGDSWSAQGMAYGFKSFFGFGTKTEDVRQGAPLGKALFGK